MFSPESSLLDTALSDYESVLSSWRNSEMGKNFINNTIGNNEGYIRVRLAPFYYSGMPSVFRTKQGYPIKAIGKIIFIIHVWVCRRYNDRVVRLHRQEV